MRERETREKSQQSKEKAEKKKNKQRPLIHTEAGGRLNAFNAGGGRRHSKKKHKRQKEKTLNNQEIKIHVIQQLIMDNE